MLSLWLIVQVSFPTKASFDIPCQYFVSCHSSLPQYLALSRQNIAEQLEALDINRVALTVTHFLEGRTFDADEAEEADSGNAAPASFAAMLAYDPAWILRFSHEV